jgi:hypothetical protein
VLRLAITSAAGAGHDVLRALRIFEDGGELCRKSQKRTRTFDKGKLELMTLGGVTFGQAEISCSAPELVDRPEERRHVAQVASMPLPRLSPRTTP